MYAIAEQVRDWLAEGRHVLLGQVVATTGFSSRDPSSALAWTAGREPIGSLIAGVPPSQVTGADGPGYLQVTVGDAEARAAGLSCGGTASVLVTSAAAYPAGFWSRLVERQPVCVTTALPDGEIRVLTTDTIRDAFPFGSEIPRLFGRGTSLTTVVESDGNQLAVVSLWPVPSLVVVGEGLIATALLDAATLLGWTARICADGAAAEIASLRGSDAVVVLSHDLAVSGAALRAALESPAGYVGALGSRRTQAARRQWLVEHGTADHRVDAIHGPAGLDIDAHTPAEIAVSIVAEILASRSGSGGGALRDRPGPVHVAGVQAPPPRYAAE